MNSYRKILISSFIVFNFLAMIRIHLPFESKYISTLYKPVDMYLSFFSIYQEWKMFAPNPIPLNIYITADVEFDDGTISTYDFEHGNQGNIFKRYAYGEKYRKFVNDGLRSEKLTFLRQDAAKFALRKLRKDNFDKLPLKVHLTRHWYDTLNPSIEFRPHRSPRKQPQSYRFYTYEVM